MKYQILQGDNRQTLKTLADNSIDAIITDPPYGIDFLGKAWDANTGALETYQECLRVLKPGGHILAFSAARTYHHLAVTLEQAGFEIRDQIMWIYSSGFPKSQDVGRSIQRSLGVKEHYSIEEWEDKQGYTVNHPGETYGFGDPNSKDGHGDAGLSGKIAKVTDPEAKQWAGWGTALKPAHEPIALARKPIKLSIAKNAQKWGTGALNIDATRVGDEVITTVIKKSEDNSRWYKHSKEEENIPKEVDRQDNVGRFPSNVIGEILQADYQKYFYCPKVSRRERHMGFEDPNTQGNNHPTVKPIELMKYLIKLITPPGGIVLDPFNGSGSTGCAAVELGHEYIGCELDPAYVEIAKKRIEAWANKDSVDNNFEALFSAA